MILLLHLPHLPHIPCIVLQNPASLERLNLLLEFDETPVCGQASPKHQNASINHRIREADSPSVPWEHSLQDSHRPNSTYYSNAHVSKDCVGDLSLKVFDLFAVLVLLKGVGSRVGSDYELRTEDQLEHLQLPVLRRRGHKINCDLINLIQTIYPLFSYYFTILFSDLPFYMVCLIYLKGYRITMSSFKSKAQLLKAQLCE